MGWRSSSAPATARFANDGPPGLLVTHTLRTDVSEFESVLVYDGDCPFCSAASSALRRTRGVGVVPWEDEAAQRFLEMQFEDAPFALVFVDGGARKVYVGREAARELCERAGLPTLMSDLVGENYEAIADAVRTVSGLDDEPDPYHGSFPLADEAAKQFKALAVTAEGPGIVVD